MRLNNRQSTTLRLHLSLRGIHSNGDKPCSLTLAVLYNFCHIKSSQNRWSTQEQQMAEGTTGPFMPVPYSYEGWLLRVLLLLLPLLLLPWNAAMYCCCCCSTNGTCGVSLPMVAICSRGSVRRLFRQATRVDRQSLDSLPARPAARPEQFARPAERIGYAGIPGRSQRYRLHSEESESFPWRSPHLPALSSYTELSLRP